MGKILTDFSPQAMITAIEANFFEYVAYNARSPQVELYDGPDMLRFISGVPHPMLNHIFRAKLLSENIDGQIDEILTYFKTHRLPMIWWTGPATRPTDLGKYLKAHGLIFDAPAGSGMAADLRTLHEDLPTPTGLTIECVGDEKALKKWLHPFSAGFEFPDYAAKAWFDIVTSVGFDSHAPVRHYIGLLKGAPVASSTLFLGAGVAGIYNVATVPEARRQGIGAAITMVPLREARARGYRIGILQSSTMAQGMYRRLGFKEYCKIGTYIWSEDTNQQK